MSIIVAVFKEFMKDSKWNIFERLLEWNFSSKIGHEATIRNQQKDK